MQTRPQPPLVSSEVKLKYQRVCTHSYVVLIRGSFLVALASGPVTVAPVCGMSLADWTSGHIEEGQVQLQISKFPNGTSLTKVTGVEPRLHTG